MIDESKIYEVEKDGEIILMSRIAIRKKYKKINKEEISHWTLRKRLGKFNGAIPYKELFKMVDKSRSRKHDSDGVLAESMRLEFVNKKYWELFCHTPVQGY